MTEGANCWWKGNLDKKTSTEGGCTGPLAHNYRATHFTDEWKINFVFISLSFLSPLFFPPSVYQLSWLFIRLTHWKQNLFLLNSGVSVNEGDILQGQAKICRHSEWRRHLRLIVTFTHICQLSGQVSFLQHVSFLWMVFLSNGNVPQMQKVILKVLCTENSELSEFSSVKYGLG